jgi:ankyrin repeat protein
MSNLLLTADGDGTRPYSGQAYLYTSPYSNGSFQWIILGNGITPLMTSVDIESLQLAINRGDDINAKDIFGRTALMIHSFCSTYSQNNLPVSQFLIENGADTNIKDNEGRTALFYAVWGGNVEAAIMLINNGADVNIIDNKGYTPLDIAHISGNSAQSVLNEFINILLASGAKNNAVAEIIIGNERMRYYRDSVLVDNWWPTDLYISYSDR